MLFSDSIIFFLFKLKISLYPYTFTHTLHKNINQISAECMNAINLKYHNHHNNSYNMLKILRQFNKIQSK